MKKWYRKPVTKGILILLAHVTAVFAVISLAIIMNFSGNISRNDAMKAGNTSYEESASFQSLLYRVSIDIVEVISTKNNVETDGKYDPDKLVDIVNFAKKGTISGENENGLVYEMDDLLKWSREYDDEYGGKNIVVCERSNGTYYYYHIGEFKKQIAEGKLRLEVEGTTTDQYLSNLEEGYFTSGYSGDIQIKNQEGEILYINCWTFNESLKEKATPAGAADIIEVVNKTPELNGNLSNVYSYLRTVLGEFSYMVDRYQYAGEEWGDGNTNLTYLYVDPETKKVYTNNPQYKEYQDAEKNLEQIKQGKNNKFLIVRPKLVDFETNMDVPASDWKALMSSVNNNESVFAISVDTKFPIQDVFYSDRQQYETYAPFLKTAFVGGIICAIAFFAILIWMVLIAGKSADDDTIKLGAFDRWKTELAAAFSIGIWAFPFVYLSSMGLTTMSASSAAMTVDTSYHYSGSNADYSFYGDIGSSLGTEKIVWIGFLTAFTVACFLFGFFSLVRRFKAKTIWKNSIIRIICLFIGDFWRNRKGTFKTIVVVVALLCIHWITMLSAGGDGTVIMVMLLSEALAVYFLLQNAIAKNKIQKGIKQIASGDVNYQIPLQHLKGDNRKMAEMVNNIGNGLQNAVEKGLRSERLKTDLITNVSHDIKTPLTSIINYVDLLKRENMEDPKIQNYLDILEEKAQRLKTLTEDVVEASKVSSGSITLERMDVNWVEMINQTAGEFEEKFKANDLHLVQTLPENPAIIYVDGRRMWRVLENIYNNAAKYAMPGTRVYSDLVVGQETISFSLKNISQQPLNISEDELTERFIRGDVSRSTEGSGLGLSIAKSLTTMQGGDFKLYLDGDLFKVTIAFPKK